MVTKKTAVKNDKTEKTTEKKSAAGAPLGSTAARGVETAVEKKKNYAKISVAGDITIKSVTAMKKTVKELIDEGFINLAFDLSGARYVDSSGLGFFIGTLKTLKEKHGAMHITGLNDHIKGLFNLINLTNIFEIFEDPKDAFKF